MKETEQRIAIAEACGWTGIYKHTKDALGYGKLRGLNPNALRGHSNIQELPNYLSDLNAMGVAETVIIRQGQSVIRRYEDALQKHVANIVFCNAAQRAEAFLRTLDLWTDL